MIFLARILLCILILYVQLWIYRFELILLDDLWTLMGYFCKFLLQDWLRLLFFDFFINKLIWEFIFLVILFDNKIKNFLIGILFGISNTSDIPILKLFKLLFENLYIFVIYHIIWFFVPCWVIFQTFIGLMALKTWRCLARIKNVRWYRAMSGWNFRSIRFL